MPQAQQTRSFAQRIDRGTTVCTRSSSISKSRNALESPVPRKTHVHGHDTPRAKLKMNYCFGCGKDNPEGLRLKFHVDESGQRFVARFRLARRFTGPPGHA